MPERAGTEYDTRDVTNSELMRAVVLLRKDIGGLNEKFAAVPTSKDLDAVKDVSNERFDYLKERIHDLENWQTWALRLGIPGLCVAALNAVNTFGGVVAK